MRRRFAVSDLPVELREQLGALRQGDEIALVDDGVVVATVEAAPAPVVLPAVPRPRSTPPRSAERQGVKLVATGMKLTERVRAFLSTALGEEYALVDIRKAPATIDALLVPPMSVQALGILRRQFPQAQLIVAELDDPASDTWVAGPVSRAKAAGAHAYLTPETLGDLASEVRLVVEGRAEHALASGGGRADGVRELED